jgi:hypothetical protein
LDGFSIQWGEPGDGGESRVPLLAPVKNKASSWWMRLLYLNF